MTARLDYAKATPAGFKAMVGLQNYITACGLEHSLQELVKIRASQINACAFCLNMHTREARKAGETEARLYMLSAWREATLYTARERAALAWTEALTNLPAAGAPADVFGQVQALFSEKELADLTWVIVTINAWNRLQVAFNIPPEAETA